MNTQERKEAEGRVERMAVRLHEMAQEVFSAECKRRDQVRNMAVLSSALVRAGVKVTCNYCPPEQLPEAMQGLVLQINQEMMKEVGPPPGEGEGLNGAGSSVVEGSGARQVQEEVDEPQDRPEE